MTHSALKQRIILVLLVFSTIQSAPVLAAVDVVDNVCEFVMQRYNSKTLENEFVKQNFVENGLFDIDIPIKTGKPIHILIENVDNKR